jgi:hypothetical protein
MGAYGIAGAFASMEEASTMTKRQDEYGNFDQAMKRIISVSHDELKAKLDAEKLTKSKSHKKKRTPKEKK